MPGITTATHAGAVAARAPDTFHLLMVVGRWRASEQCDPATSLLAVLVQETHDGRTQHMPLSAMLGQKSVSEISCSEIS